MPDSCRPLISALLPAAALVCAGPFDDLYLVYNARLNTGRGGTQPIVPLSGGRTILVKYTYTFAR